MTAIPSLLPSAWVLFFSLQYQFKRILGRGSFKTVYAAFDTVDALEVAWNKLHVERLNQEERKKIINEVRLLGQINHKNIIRLYDSFPCSDANSDGEGSIAFITEQMMSGTLKQYLKMAQNVKLKVIRKWCSNILEAVAYLHERRIMHRDLKLDNLFMNGHVGEVKIGDLGLSAVRDANQKAESVIGTPEFMAPELYEEAYTEKVDIYAFGMCLLEMVTMEYPYAECKGPAQIMKKVFNSERPESFHRLANSDVKDLIAQCLEREANRPSAAQLLQHPLFRDWELDDGKRSNLSLIQDTMSLEIPNGPEEGDLSEAIANAPTIAFSEQLNRDVLVETREAIDSAAGDEDAGISVTPANMGGVAGGAVGGFRLELQWPFDNSLKSVSFSFNPGDRAEELAGEMVAEFGLAPSQLALLTEAIDAKVKEMIDQREREQENFARSPRLYGLPTASTDGLPAASADGHGHVPPQQTANGGDEHGFADHVLEASGLTGINNAVGSDLRQEIVGPDTEESDAELIKVDEVNVPPRSSSVPPRPVSLPAPCDAEEIHPISHEGNLGQSRSLSLQDPVDKTLQGLGVATEVSVPLSQVKGQILDTDIGDVVRANTGPESPMGILQGGKGEVGDQYSSGPVSQSSSAELNVESSSLTLPQLKQLEHVHSGQTVPPSPKQPPVRVSSTARSIVVVGGDKKSGASRELTGPLVSSDVPARTLTTSVAGDVLADSHELMAGARLAEAAAGMQASSSATAVTPVSMIANASLPPPVPVLPAAAGEPSGSLTQQHVAQHSLPQHVSPPQQKQQQQAHSQDFIQHMPQQLTSRQQPMQPPSLASLPQGPASSVHISASSPSNLSIRTTSFRSAQSDDSGGLSSSLLSPAQSAPVPAVPVLGNGMQDSDYDQKWYTMCLELMHNASRGRFALVKQKLAQGASVTFADYDKRTPLHLAAAAGSLPTVNVLIENGANVNARDRWDGTPLRDAVSEKHMEVIVRLREAGALDDEDGGDDAIDKPGIELIQFSSNGNLPAVKERVSSGVLVSVADYEQRTPLHLACSHGHADVVDFLLLNGADPLVRDKAGRTPLDNAVRNGHRNVLEVLKRQDTDAPIHALMSDSRSPTVTTVGQSSSPAAPAPQTRSVDSGVWTADKELPSNGEETGRMNGAGRPKSSPNQFNQDQLALLQTQAAISHSISMGHIGIGSDGFADSVDGRVRHASNNTQYPGPDHHMSGGLSSQSLPATEPDMGSDQDVKAADDASVREEIERERFRYEQERSRLDAEYRAKIEGLHRKTTATSNRKFVDHRTLSPPVGVGVSGRTHLTSDSGSDQGALRSDVPVGTSGFAGLGVSEKGSVLSESSQPSPPNIDLSNMALDPQSKSRPSSLDAALQHATQSPLPTIQVQVLSHGEQSIPESIVTEMVEDSVQSGSSAH